MSLEILHKRRMLAKPPDTTPPTIGTLSYVSSTANSVTLSWTPATDDYAIDYYYIYYKLMEGDVWSSVLAEGTSGTVPNLTSGTYYNFHLRARDVNGNWSFNSNYITASTL